MATEKQINFINRLVGERVIPDDARSVTEAQHHERLLDIGGGKEVSTSEASSLIDYLLSLPKNQPDRPRSAVDPGLTPGVFETNGAVYLVRFNREQTNLYACKLVELDTARRLTDEGEVIPVDFVYDKGAIFSIKPEHRLSLARAKELSIRYGKCIICTRKLKAAKSVEQGIGPVCIKTQLGASVREAALAA